VVGRLAVIRADASPTIGIGHIVRCMALAEALVDQNYEVHFASQAGTIGSAPMLNTSKFKYFELSVDPSCEIAEIKKTWPNGVDLLVTDGYQLDCGFESNCRNWSKTILSIDDLADRRHHCDFLLDSSPNRKSSDYARLVPPHCKLLLGVDFALLRNAFAEKRETALTKRYQQNYLARILVNFGGSDASNLTPTALRAIEKSGAELVVDVMMGAAANNRAEVEDTITKIALTTQLHVGVTDPSDLMANADLAIGAGGGTAWERCAVGLPSIVIQTSHNQRSLIDSLTARNAIWFAGPRERIEVNKLANLIWIVLSDIEEWRDVSSNAAILCDGLGSRRVAQALTSIVTENGDLNASA
jgi:UDP-2,4-diacetamido-2,4,6-trideoxy-beta-L-altropyranose hydrolase